MYTEITSKIVCLGLTLKYFTQSKQSQSEMWEEEQKTGEIRGHVLKLLN